MKNVLFDPILQILQVNNHQNVYFVCRFMEVFELKLYMAVQTAVEKNLSNVSIKW